MTRPESTAVPPFDRAQPTGPAEPGGAREAERQRELLRAIHGGGANGGGARSVTGLAALAGRRDGAGTPDAGLAVYRANAQAHARRALAAAYPTVLQLVGDEGFAALAAALWQAQPPVCGDLAWFGAGLGDWLADAGALPGEPYLPDVARLEWAVHRAGFAADPAGPATGLALLAEAEPDDVRARFAPGLSVLASAWPVVTIWQAHRSDEPTLGDAGAQRFAEAREAMAAGRTEHALVWRRGWQVAVGHFSAAEAAFTETLMAGASLGRALASSDPAGSGFGFETWLLRALREGWLAGFELWAASDAAAEAEAEAEAVTAPATRSAAG